MNLALDCIPCFLRNALAMARTATGDTAVHEQMLKELARDVSVWDMSLPAPVLSQRVQRRLKELTGVADPYRDAKRRFNQMALDLLPELRSQVDTAADPLEAAVRVAIAGNVIDLGVNGNLRVEDVRSSLAQSVAAPFSGDLRAFREAISAAGSVLYLADNSGEIIFDRLLIERLPVKRVVVAVRGSAVLNDATMEDARVAGLHQVAEVIDNGSGAPGTVLADCSDEFRRQFQSADVVVAKGQGNFETLAGHTRDIFFLLKVKCAVVADHAGLAAGTHALLRYRNGKARDGR